MAARDYGHRGTCEWHSLRSADSASRLTLFRPDDVELVRGFRFFDLDSHRAAFLQPGGDGVDLFAGVVQAEAAGEDRIGDERIGNIVKEALAAGGEGLAAPDGRARRQLRRPPHFGYQLLACFHCRW